MADHVCDDVYDVAVIGRGPAGLAAVTELATYGLSCILFGPERHTLQDKALFPDTPLCEALKEIEFCCKAGFVNEVARKVTKVCPLEVGAPIKLVDDENKVWQARSVIVTSGARQKSLFGDTPEFTNCIFTDIQEVANALQNRGKTTDPATLVIVAAASTQTLLLLERLPYYANYKKIIVVTTTKFEPSIPLQRIRDMDKNKVEIHEEAVVASLEMDEEKQEDLRDVYLQPSGGRPEIKVSCNYLLTLLGTIPNTTFLEELDVALGSKKQVQTDDQYCTSASGIFAAGSVRQCPCDAIEAMHQGRCASKQAIKHVENLKPGL